MPIDRRKAGERRGHDTAYRTRNFHTHQHIVGQRGGANGPAPGIIVDVQQAITPCDACCRPGDFEADSIVEARSGFIGLEPENMVENLDQGFEEVGLARSILANEDIDEPIAIETNRKITEVFVLADPDRSKAHYRINLASLSVSRT